MRWRRMLPTTQALTGVFAPSSDQSWLTIGTIANGVVNFSFTANTGAAARTAHISLLGQQITVTQAARPNATINISPYTSSGTTYDGASHTATGTATGVGGVNLSSGLILTGTTHTNAGTYLDSWSFHDPSGNYQDAGGTITDSIGKASSTTTTVGAGPFTYTGSAQVGGSGTVTGAGGLSTSATSLTYSANANGTGTADQTDAGTYYVTAHYAGDANHMASDGAAVAIVIGQASSTTTTVGAGPFTYTGSAQVGGSGTVTGARPQHQRHLADLLGQRQWHRHGRPDRRRHLLRDGPLCRRRQPPGQRRRCRRHHHQQGVVHDDHGGRRPVHLHRQRPDRRLGHGDRGRRLQHQRHSLTYSANARWHRHGRPDRRRHLLRDRPLRRRRQPPGQRRRCRGHHHQQGVLHDDHRRAPARSPTPAAPRSAGSGTVTGAGGFSTSATR